jgi:hypothetical protein
MVNLLSCGNNREANQKKGSDLSVKALATVNDVPITEYEVKQSMKRSVAHGGGVTPEAAQNALQSLVRNELIYQKSLELGLDKDPQFIAKVSEVEAQIRDFKRQEMAALYANYIRSKAEVTDAEAKAYFEKNAPRMQTKYHIWQIFYRGNQAQITKDYQDLKSGMPFEKVALRRFPNLPKEVKAPWDLGYLEGNQIPEPWQGALERLEPGKTSDIITGPNDRYWVIKLIDKKVDPKITFDMAKDKIIPVLREQKAKELSEKMLSEMKSKAKITYPK